MSATIQFKICCRPVCYSKRRGNAYEILLRKPEGKTPFARPRRKLVHNIKLAVK